MQGAYNEDLLPTDPGMARKRKGFTRSRRAAITMGVACLAGCVCLGAWVALAGTFNLSSHSGVSSRVRWVTAKASGMELGFQDWVVEISAQDQGVFKVATRGERDAAESDAARGAAVTTTRSGNWAVLVADFGKVEVHELTSELRVRDRNGVVVAQSAAIAPGLRTSGPKNQAQLFLGSPSTDPLMFAVTMADMQVAGGKGWTLLWTDKSKSPAITVGEATSGIVVDIAVGRCSILLQPAELFGEDGVSTPQPTGATLMDSSRPYIPFLIHGVPVPIQDFPAAPISHKATHASVRVRAEDASGRLASLVEALRVAVDDKAVLPVHEFVQVSRELAAVLDALPPALRFAFGPIRGFAGHVEAREARFRDVHDVDPSHQVTMQELIAWGASQGTGDLTIQPLQQEMWLWEFAGEVLISLGSANVDFFPLAVTDSFARTLGTHQSFALRTSLSASFAFLPTRQQCFVMLGEADNEANRQVVLQAAQLLIRLRHELQAAYRA